MQSVASTRAYMDRIGVHNYARHAAFRPGEAAGERALEACASAQRACAVFVCPRARVGVCLRGVGLVQEAPEEDGQLLQPVTAYVPMQLRPMTDARTLNVDPPFEHVGVAVEPSWKVMVEPKDDAIPKEQEHPETAAGVTVMAPEAALEMV